MNWEEAAITAILLGFGPPKMADRAWFAVQQRRAERQERRIKRARAHLEEVRAGVEQYAAQLALEFRRQMAPRYMMSGYPDCHRCGHVSYVHQEGGSCTQIRVYPNVPSDILTSSVRCHCPQYTAGGLY